MGEKPLSKQIRYPPQINDDEWSGWDHDYKAVPLEWLNKIADAVAQLEDALRDLITIIELEDMEDSPDPMERIAAQEKVLQNVKELLGLSS